MISAFLAGICFVCVFWSAEEEEYWATWFFILACAFNLTIALL